MIRAALATGLAGAALLVPSAQAYRSCGLTPRIHGVRYDVRETHGSVGCKTVKAVVTRFLRNGSLPAASAWMCFRNHGGSPYAASCSRKYGAKAVVRVYAPT